MKQIKTTGQISINFDAKIESNGTDTFYSQAQAARDARQIPAQDPHQSTEPRFKVIHNRTGRQHCQANSIAELTGLLYEPTAEAFTVHDQQAGDFFNADLIFNSKPTKK